MSHPQCSSHEIAARGQALFELEILPGLDASAHGKFLALDVETGEYEIDRDELAALKRAQAKRPQAPLYLLRVGYPTAYRVGRRAVTSDPREVLVLQSEGGILLGMAALMGSRLTVDVVEEGAVTVLPLPGQ